MSNYPEPPPPYPGTDTAGNAYNIPPNPAAYSAPYDASKGFSGYNDPTRPGGGYSSTGYQQAAGPGVYTHGTAVVVTQPAVAVMQVFRESPVHCTCPHCRAEVVTGTHFETGTFTWVVCCVLWLVGCGLGCCLIPFCVDSCKDVIHTCPSCRQQIARYSRM